MTSSEFLNHGLVTALLIAACYAGYQLLLRKQTAFQYNRRFILLTLLFSMVLPYLSFDFGTLQPVIMEELNIQPYLSFFHPADSATSAPSSADPGLDLIGLVVTVYWIGLGLFGLRYVRKLWTIHALIQWGTSRKVGRYTYLLVNKEISPFAFHHYIVMNQATFAQADKSIHWHEQGHVDHRHTLDLLLVELLVMCQWFNPFIYLFKRRLVEIHEYQADAHVIQQGVPIPTYQRLLLDTVHSTPSTSLASPFHNSQLKNRILMVNHYPATSLSLTKRICIWLLMGVLFLSYACTELNPDLVPYQTGLDANPLASTTSSMSVAADISEEAPSFMLPIPASELKRISSGFGMRMHPLLKKQRFHGGVDFLAPMGTEVYASADGIIKMAHYDGNWGKRIQIMHSAGFGTDYAHMKVLFVKAGQHVKQGDLIGYLGNTGMSVGPHLHFEIRKDGERVNPEGYLEQ